MFMEKYKFPGKQTQISQKVCFISPICDTFLYLEELNFPQNKHQIPEKEFPRSHIFQA